MSINEVNHLTGKAYAHGLNAQMQRKAGVYLEALAMVHEKVVSKEWNADLRDEVLTVFQLVGLELEPTLPASTTGEHPCFTFAKWQEAMSKQPVLVAYGDWVEMQEKKPG